MDFLNYLSYMLKPLLSFLAIPFMLPSAIFGFFLIMPLLNFIICHYILKNIKGTQNVLLYIILSIGLLYIPAAIFMYYRTNFTGAEGYELLFQAPMILFFIFIQAFVIRNNKIIPITKKIIVPIVFIYGLHLSMIYSFSIVGILSLIGVYGSILYPLYNSYNNTKKAQN